MPNGEDLQNKPLTIFEYAIYKYSIFKYCEMCLISICMVVNAF